MKIDEIRRIVADCQALYELCQESSLYTSPSIYDFTYDDLKIAAEVFGGEIEHCSSAENPFYYLEIGEVTLFT